MTTSTSSQVETEPLTGKPRPFALPNIIVRMLTGLVLIPLVLAGAFLGGWLWMLLTVSIAILCLLEFYALVDRTDAALHIMIGVPTTILILLCVTLQLDDVLTGVMIGAGVVTALVWRIRSRGRSLMVNVIKTWAGLGYITLPMALLILLRDQPDGFLWVMIVFGVTAGTDTLAYVGGGLFGRTPLAPVLSPKKTVEGAVFGLLGACIIVCLFANVRGQLNLAVLAIAIFGPMVAVIGDLLESALKRRFRVKDSHITGLNIVPGHGGVLDRADSLLLVTPFVFSVLWFANLIM